MATQSRHRRSTRLRGYDYTRVGVYSVTICSRHGKVLFGDVIDGEMHLSELGKIVHAAWDDLPTLYPHIVLDEFIVMPNHVHAIIALIGFLFAKGVMNHAPTGSHSDAIHIASHCDIPSPHSVANSAVPPNNPVGARFIAPFENRRNAEGVMNHAPTGSHSGAIHEPARFIAPHSNAIHPDFPLLHSVASQIDRAPAGSLGDVVRGFKARATRAINRHRGAVGSGVWLRGYYDDIIRDDAHLRCARQYVRDNPRRWELTHKPLRRV